jgi:hypothetical protein
MVIKTSAGKYYQPIGVVSAINEQSYCIYNTKLVIYPKSNEKGFRRGECRAIYKLINLK